MQIAGCQQGWLTSVQMQSVHLAGERQETESVHFFKPGALGLMFCIFINLFQWSKTYYSEGRKGWKIVLDALLVLQHITVNYLSSNKLESKQRPHDSNCLLHYSFVCHTEQSFERQRSGDKHQDPRMDLNSETEWISHQVLGFSALCSGAWDMDAHSRADLSQGSSTDPCSMLLRWCTSFKSRCSTAGPQCTAFTSELVREGGDGKNRRETR